MREISKNEAIAEYGVRYVPALQPLNLDLHGPRKLSPEAALAKKLEQLSAPDFDGHIHLTEELGAPTESFHYKDLADIQQRLEVEERGRYRETLDELSAAIMSPENSQMVGAAANSALPEHKRLRAAFEEAHRKMVLIDQFLNAGKPFALDVEAMKPVLSLPRNIAKTGDAVYVVSDDGKSLPSVTEGRVEKADFHRSFFKTKSDFGIQYGIDMPAAPGAKKNEDTYVAVDAEEDDVPKGAVARCQHKLVFNDRAAAAEHMTTALNTRAQQLVQQLREIREMRRKPFSF